MSSNMLWLRPDRIEPLRKTTIAAWKKNFRPYWSPSFPHKRRGDRGGEQVGDDDPGEVRGAVEIGDDRRERRRHDRLVEGGQEHAEHERPDDDEHTAMAEVRDGHRLVDLGRRLAHRASSPVLVASA